MNPVSVCWLQGSGCGNVPWHRFLSACPRARIGLCPACRAGWLWGRPALHTSSSSGSLRESEAMERLTTQITCRRSDVFALLRVQMWFNALATGSAAEMLCYDFIMEKKKRPLLLFRCGVASLLSWQLPKVIKVMSCNLNPSTVPSNHFTRVKNMLLVTMWWEMNVIFNQFDSLGISFHIRATNCGYRYRVIGCKMSLNTETVGHNVQNPKIFNVLLHCCKKTSSLEPEKVWHSY